MGKLQLVCGARKAELLPVLGGDIGCIPAYMHWIRNAMTKGLKRDIKSFYNISDLPRLKYLYFASSIDLLANHLHRTTQQATN